MNIRSIVVIAGASLLLLSMSMGATVAQEPTRKASVEGVVVRAGTGMPLTGARVTLTVTSARGGAGAGGGLGGPGGISAADLAGAPPELQAMLIQQMQAGGDLGGAARGGRGAAVPIPPMMTDDKGHFSFGNLDPGTYRVQVQANGYVAQDYGQRYTGGPGTPITLIAGQEKTDVSVNLTPAGNVSGRVRDVNEQPLPNVPVQLLRPTYDSSGKKRLQTVGSGRTDDRGEFRIYWVSPGRYYLKAGTQGGDSLIAMLALMGGGVPGIEGGNPNEVPSAAATAYYPGAPDISGARAVEVFPGADLTAVDWALPAQPITHRITGRLVDARTGKPPTQAQVVMMPLMPGFAMSQDSLGIEALLGGGIPGLGGRQYNPATGLMEFKDVASGTYAISAFIENNGGYGGGGRGIDGPVGGGGFGGIDGGFAGGGGSGVMTGSAIVTVGDADVDGVVITIVPAGSLTGRLQLEGDFPAPPAPAQRGGGRGGAPGGGDPRVTPGGGPAAPGAPGGARGNVRPRNVQLVSMGSSPLSEITGGTSSGSANADGAFRINNVAPGEYRISVAPLSGNAYLKSAQLSGVDVLETPLAVTGPVSGVLDVVVSANGGQVQGDVVNERSEPVAVIQVVLIPNRSRGRVDLYKMVTANTEGHFSMTGVAPGDYKLFAWQKIDPYSWYDPEILERSEDRGSPVHVSESSTETVTVKIIPAGGGQ